MPFTAAAAAVRTGRPRLEAGGEAALRLLAVVLALTLTLTPACPRLFLLDACDTWAACLRFAPIGVSSSLGDCFCKRLRCEAHGRHAHPALCITRPHRERMTKPLWLGSSNGGGGRGCDILAERVRLC